MGFESIKEQPGGLGPERTAVQTHWSVTVEDGRFEYAHTDVVESGSYTCTVEDGIAKLSADRDGAESLTGTYDPETAVLEWAGVRYRPGYLQFGWARSLSFSGVSAQDQQR